MSFDLFNKSTTAKKPRGAAHMLAATRYSIDGFRRILRETAFRHEVIIGAGMLGIFALVGAGPLDYLVQVVLILVLVACEALNTAIEIIVDRVSPEVSEFAKQAKDLGSFAVFCLVLANAGFAGSVLLRVM